MASHDLSMDLPVVDLDIFLSAPRDSEAVIQECKKVGIQERLFCDSIIHLINTI